MRGSRRDEMDLGLEQRTWVACCCDDGRADDSFRRCWRKTRNDVGAASPLRRWLAMSTKDFPSVFVCIGAYDGGRMRIRLKNRAIDRTAGTNHVLLNATTRAKKTQRTYEICIFAKSPIHYNKSHTRFMNIYQTDADPKTCVNGRRQQGKLLPKQ